MGDCCSLATVIVAEPFNVILTKIIAALDFDENERCVDDVLNAMLCANGDVKYRTRDMFCVDIVEREACAAGNNHPKLFPTLMALVGQPRTGIHRDALHLMRIGALEDVVSTPGSDILWQ